MNYLAIGLLMILATLCAIVYTAFLLGLRGHVAQETLKLIASLEER